MREMIGTPDVFAVEFEIKTRAPYLMGYARLWVQGVLLGDFEDQVMLLCVYGDVEGLIECAERMQNPDLLKLEDQALFDLMYDGEFNNSPYLIFSTENFDDFYTFAFTAGDEMHFFWQLARAFRKYPADYPRGVVHKKVPIKAIQEVVQALREAFKDFFKSPR